MDTKPRHRKIFVIATLNLTAVSSGFAYGHMSGLSRALQEGAEGIVLSEHETSLIASFATIACFPGMMSIVIGDIIGRRWAFITYTLPLALNWIILYNARTFPAFMISRFLAGISIGPLAILNLVAMSEYTSPKWRGVLLSAVSMMGPAFGNVIAHLIGIVINWRTLSLLGLTLSIMHLVLPFFWIESPQWLASKGRFEDCEKAFHNINEKNPNSDEELRLLLKMETNKQKAGLNRKANTFKIFLAAFRKRFLWNLIILITFLYTYYAAAGKLVFSVLATVVLEDITGSPDILLYTLVVDGFVFTGTCLSCILIKKCTIRFLLFSSGVTANVILIILSACLWFKNSAIYFQWTNVVLLAFYFIIVNAGPYPVIEILLGEMFPLEIKLYCFLLAAPIFAATIASSILFLPYFISVMGYHGLFLMNSGIMFVCLYYFYVKLPETKGKTLQEIELYFKTKNYDVDQVLSNNEQIKALF